MSIVSLRRPPAEPPTKPRPNAPTERPRGVDPDRIPLPLGAPARSVDVLAELHAADAPIVPTAMRQAFDRHANMPPVPLRRVRLATPPADDMELTAATVAAWLAARPELGDRHDVAMILAPLAAMLAEVSL